MRPRETQAHTKRCNHTGALSVQLLIKTLWWSEVPNVKIQMPKALNQVETEGNNFLMKGRYCESRSLLAVVFCSVRVSAPGSSGYETATVSSVQQWLSWIWSEKYYSIDSICSHHVWIQFTVIQHNLDTWMTTHVGTLECHWVSPSLFDDWELSNF